ncbi:MAG: beta strand repeat-containing protein, partial [Acidobacteriota bacterium]
DLLTGGAINFVSAVNAAAAGAEGLTVAAGAGTVQFEGNVGGTSLSSLVVTAGGISLGGAGGSVIHATGSLSFTGPIVLLHDETMTSDHADIAFVGTVSTINGAHALSLFAGTGTVSLGGSVGGTTALTTLLVDPSSIILGGTTYHTSGGQTYSEAVTLGSSAALIADTGNIVFTKTIDGGNALSATASAGTVSVGGVIGGTTALTGLSITGGSRVSVLSIFTNGTQRLTSGGTINIGGTYHTGDGSFTAAGTVSLSGAATIDPGTGSLSVSGPLNGAANLAVLGSGAATFSSIDLDNTGTIDLSGKTGGSLTVTANVTAAALITGSGTYSLSLLGGGTIGDPTLANTGGDTLAGSFLFTDGLTIPGELTLAGNTVIDTETSGIVLGTVQQGANAFVIIADAVTLNGAWTGTGARGITPFSNLTIGLGDGAGNWQLNQQALNILADPPSIVVIGGGTAIIQEIQNLLTGQPLFVPPNPPGPIHVGTFTFDAPLLLIGSAISIDGTLSKTSGGLGFITPGAVNGAGSLDLGPGTGILEVAADSANINGTVDGVTGGGATGETVLVGSPGSGPYDINGACFGDCGPKIGQIPGGTIIYTNNLNGVFGAGGIGAPPSGNTGGGGGLGGVSPQAGGDTSQTDVLVADLSGPANSKAATQAVARVQGFYVSLLGNLLYEWRPLSGQLQGPITPEQNTDYSNWGAEARW